MTRTAITPSDASTDGSNVTSFTQLNVSASFNIDVSAGKFFGYNARTYDNTAAAVWSGAGTFTDDQYASLVVGGLSSLTNTVGIGVICRASTDTDGARDFYGAHVASEAVSGGSSTTTLFKIANGTASILGSGAAQAAVVWTNGDRIELECEGATIRLCKNGTALGGVFTQIDSSPLTGGKPGIIGSGGSGIITGDDFIGGSLSGGGASPFYLEDPDWFTQEAQTNPLTISVWG